MKAEDSLQIAVANYLRLAYPKVLWAHIANERQTSPQRGAKLKKMGVRAGMPDILIFAIGGVGIDKEIYSGLAIELKIKPNKCTKPQLECLNLLENADWKTFICYSFEDAKWIIDKYLK